MNPHPHLFIVDDDPEERYLLQLALSDAGWHQEVQLFTTGAALLQHLSLLTPAQYPALLVLDYHMPQMNGRTLLLALKAQPLWQHIPVVIYSALLPPDTARELLALGARHCFRKAQHYAEAISFAQQLQGICNSCTAS